ncbi:FMN-binding negative transcriptional regulator [Jannaschia sp. KMU-145]|uniref:FMN-binding negative transcriptional regulator n=1 Tax=Jannaschia halovivens TaxID=3388667 RepID=UPI00396B1915
MHPNLTFRSDADARTLDLIRDRAFGTLAVNAADGPLLSHIPVHLSGDASHVLLHLVRSNPILRALGDGLPAVIAVTGPDGYVSPNWYGIDDQVPTWNYVAVHLRGPLRRLDPGEMRATLDAQSEPYEMRTNPEMPWTADKMTPEVLERMMRQIVPLRMDVDSIAATWKLSQNKPDDVRLRAADAIETAEIGSDLPELARMMRTEG